METYGRAVPHLVHEHFEHQRAVVIHTNSELGL